MQGFLKLNKLSFPPPSGVPKDTIQKSPKLEEETFEIRKVKIPLDIKQEIDGEANSPGKDAKCQSLQTFLGCFEPMGSFASLLETREVPHN